MIYDYLYSIAVFAEGLNSAGSGDIRLSSVFGLNAFKTVGILYRVLRSQGRISL